MGKELSNEQITALLSGRDINGELFRFSRIKTNYPILEHKYLRLSPILKKCSSRGCTVPDNILVNGVPYCTHHAFNALLAIIDSLESKLNDEVITNNNLRDITSRLHSER